MSSSRPSLSSTHDRYSIGMRRRSSGAIPSFDMCQVSIAMPPFAAPAPPTTSSAASTLLTFTSNGMNS